MDLSVQENRILQRFLYEMEKIASENDDYDSKDRSLIRVFKKFIGNRDYTDMIDILTTMAMYYIENEILLTLVIPDVSVSDRTIERLFFDTIDEVDVEKRMKILEMMSVHRYMLFENIVNKVSILGQLSDFIDGLLIEPGTA